jgi:NADH-quinone oxidoreductase subunit I
MKQISQTLKGLWSLIVGLKITGIEFWKPWLTVHYPRQEVDNLDSYRGHIELVPSDNDPDVPRCIMCWRCSDICPSGCISLRVRTLNQVVESQEVEEGLFLSPGIQSPNSSHLRPAPEKIERVLERYQLNYSLCSLCGLCVQTCPVDAIRFSRHVYYVGSERADFELDLIARMKSPQSPSALSSAC